MDAWARQMLDWITAYYGNGVYLLLAIVAYIYMFLFEKRNRIRIIYPIVLMIFLVVNPVLYAYIYSHIIYWRLLWLFPNGIVIAYALVSFVQKRKHMVSKVAVLALFAALIVFKGTNIYDNSGMSKAENQQKVAVRVENACNHMLSLSEHPRCIVPYEFYSQVRQYSGDIETMYGRNAEGYINAVDDVGKKVADELSKETPDYDYIFGVAMIRKYEFVIADSRKTVSEDVLSEYGYELSASYNGYSIYYSPDVEEREIGGWVVTQYGIDAGQNLFYTIEDEDNNLIIIDGGYDWWTEKVRAVIRSHDNHVSAWIVMSPHEGSAGAFCDIMENSHGIEIDNIYTMQITDAQYAKYLEHAKDWQNPEMCERLMNVLDRADNVHYVKENDELNILGLNVKVLHAWDEETEAIGEYEEFNGSLCLLVEGKTESMLFLSRLTQPMEQYIYARHSDEIDVDYVQVNNNGEWRFSAGFYDKVSPKIAFMDCGNRTMNPDTSDCNSWETYSYMLSRGVSVLYYETVPNWIILK